MKLLKSSLVGAAALALASAASASVSSATHIYITGSTAFRAATITAIGNILNTPDYAYDGSSNTGSTYGLYHGTLKSGGAEVTIKTYWSGSGAGTQAVSSGISLTKWLPDTVTTSTSGSGSTPTTGLVAATPQIAMCDVAQSLTPFTTPVLANSVKVGVVPFVFVKGVLGSGHPMATQFTAINNITNMQAQQLIGGGISLAQFTGTSADNSYKIYCLGRDPDSGTRYSTFAETGTGVSTTAAQVLPTTDLAGAITVASNGIDYVAVHPASVATSPIENINLYDWGTVNGNYYANGNNSFSSGGTLAKVLAAPVDSAAGNNIDGVSFGLIGYVGVNDAIASLKAATSIDTTRILSFNGVSLPFTNNSGTVTVDYTNLIEGKYTLWSYEYMLYGTLAAPASTVATALATQISTVDGVQSGVLSTAMNCSRSVVGSTVTHF